MIDHSVDLLLKRSELRIRISGNLSNSVTRCLERSMKAIVRSRQLLANSEALLSYPESCEPDALTLAPEKIECPATALQVIVSKRDFEGEVVSMDAKHFRNCGFRKCTLLYGGAPVTFESCRFHECKFRFSGAAGRTVQFLDCFSILSQQADDQACDPVAQGVYFLN
jgi:hypothetical protein